MVNSRMYKENSKSLNAFVGCLHDCVYCRPSFQRQAKRQKHRCLKCYGFEPHFHPERLLKCPPKTKEGEFIFFPSMGDPAFCRNRDFCLKLQYAEKYPDRDFLVQTKAPKFLLGWSPFPQNVILGITLETNKRLFETPSKYHLYDQISKAPHPFARLYDFSKIEHSRKFVTVEPILDFDYGIFPWIILSANPCVVYVGYDNHRCKLPEPSLSKTQWLIEKLEAFTEVRVKSLRRAWWEKPDG